MKTNMSFMKSARLSEFFISESMFFYLIIVEGKKKKIKAVIFNIDQR